MPQQEGSGEGGEVEPGLPPKGGRPGPPPGGGGGPGGPPGGGFVGFSGVRPQILRGISGFGQIGLPIIKRKRGFMPGVTPGPPGRSDTVPAMLSPGEMVMNTGVTQDPQQLAALMAMNQDGAEQMGFEGGGMVPDSPMSGRPPRRVLQLLKLLLELDDEDQMGAEPQGFQFGGVAGFGQNPNIQRRFFGGGAQPQGGAAPAAQGGFNYTRDAAGNQTNFNPASPWTGYQQNTGATGLGAANRLFGQAGEAGAFDPRGNQQLLSMQLEGAQGDADALVRRQMAQADLSGLDPAQRAVAKQQALRETGRGVQEIGANVRANAAGQQQQFLQDLMRDLYGADLGYIRGEQGARNERINQQNAQTQANRAGGGFWGQLGGQVLGGLAGSINPFGGGGSRVPRTAIAAPADPGLHNLPRPN